MQIFRERIAVADELFLAAVDKEKRKICRPWNSANIKKEVHGNCRLIGHIRKFNQDCRRKQEKFLPDKDENKMFKSRNNEVSCE